MLEQPCLNARRRDPASQVNLSPRPPPQKRSFYFQRISISYRSVGKPYPPFLCHGCLSRGSEPGVHRAAKGIVAAEDGTHR